MKLSLSIILLLLSSMLIAQEKNDIGAFGGTSYYFGDFNPRTQYYQPSFAGGVHFRHNLSELYSLRLSATMGDVRGEHNPDSHFLPGYTPSFSKRMTQLEGNIEIGFLPFDTKHQRRNKFSPYVILGVGGTYLQGDLLLQIPMGIGIKYSPMNRWTLGMEWKVNKTFNDNIDGYVNISDSPRSIIHNNDWFGIAGLFVSYRLVNQGAICPAYE
ncbi:MAG: DUF6089 family protein [Bacteroidales bacterium]